MTSPWGNPMLLSIYKTELAQFINMLRALGIEHSQTPADDSVDWRTILAEHGLELNPATLSLVETNGTQYLFSTGEVCYTASGWGDNTKTPQPHGVFLLTRNKQSGEISARTCYSCPDGECLPMRGAEALAHCYHPENVSP